MSGLEALISSAPEANLLESLSFDLPPQSTAIVDRKIGVHAYPTSASTLIPTGTKTCRIRLGGNEYLDASTCRLQFQITNLDANLPLQPAVGPWGVWGGMRLLSNGVELDNSQGLYHRFHEMFGWRFLTVEQQAAEAVYGYHGANNGTMHPAIGSISATNSLTVSHKLILSLTTAGKFLPLRYAPLELECSLSQPSEWLVQGVLNGNPTTSTNYSISNVQVTYDSVSLDEAVSEAMYKALISGRVLNIPCQQYFSIVQSIPYGSTSYSFSIVRAFSRLSHIWVTFRTGSGILSQEFAMPSLQLTGVSGNYNVPVFANEQPCPTVRVSIGPKNFPDAQPLSTVQEHFWALQKVLPAVPALDRRDFSTNTFVAVTDLRRVPGDATTAISTRQGDQIRIDIKGLTAAVAGAAAPTPSAAIECHVTLWAMAVVSVAERGVTILD